MSTIELRWREREIGGAQTPRKFLDFVIDGESFYEKMGGEISPLGWFVPEQNQIAVNRFLLIESPDFPDNRRNIYVCPECGDLGCGAVSAVIEEIEGRIVWRDFGYENNYDGNVLFEDYREIGPFSFEKEEYAVAIKQAEEKK